MSDQDDVQVVVAQSLATVTITHSQTDLVSSTQQALVVQQAQSQTVTRTDSVASVVTGGQVGPQGPAGASVATDSIAPIFFSYGDAAHTVWTPTVNGYLTFATVKIVTVFNGAGASIDLGAVKPANYTDPTTASEYESSPDLYLAAGTPVVLTIVPGAGASQGAGILFLTFVPE